MYTVSFECVLCEWAGANGHAATMTPLTVGVGFAQVDMTSLTSIYVCAYIYIYM